MKISSIVAANEIAQRQIGAGILCQSFAVADKNLARRAGEQNKAKQHNGQRHSEIRQQSNTTIQPADYRNDGDDGYKNNKEYSLKVIKTAYDAGANWIILCDTNGGTLPHELKNVFNEVKKIVPESMIGVHFHNDTDNATYNSLESIRNGITQVQGTFNGLGERCGNANLINVAANAILKMGFECCLKKKIHN